MRAELADELRTLDLGPAPLARGGEADVFAVPGDVHTLAKIYTDGRANLRRDKLLLLIANPPWDPPTPTGYRKFGWPTQALQDPATKSFVGFAMPRIPDARPLFELANPTIRPPHAAPYAFRLHVCRNLASVVDAAHGLGFVVGDINESNFLVTASGEVSLIDVDSLQIKSGRAVHRCLVGKGEYTPPELHGISFPDVDRTPRHDAFGLAVLAFELLAGVHPFAGRFTEPGRAPTLSEAIRRGLWPYTPAGLAEYLPPAYAPAFESHPVGLRDLWRQCFVDGHRRPDARPSASDWVRVIDAELGRPPVPVTPARPAAAATAERDALDNPVVASVALGVMLLAVGGAVFGHLRERENARPRTAPPAVAPQPARQKRAADPATHHPDPPAPDPPGAGRGGLPNPPLWEALR